MSHRPRTRSARASRGRAKSASGTASARSHGDKRREAERGSVVMRGSERVQAVEDLREPAALDLVVEVAAARELDARIGDERRIDGVVWLNVGRAEHARD